MKEATETTTMVLLPSAGLNCTSGCSRGGKTNEGSSCGPKQGDTQDSLSHASLRQLQAKMEAEYQQARKIIKPLLDTGSVKELESFLSQWDVTELRRRELLHKRWAERVWLPLHMRVEEHMSSCGPEEAKTRQSLYSQYIDHSNSKGFVFLETYDPKEYDPFLLNTKKVHCQRHERQDKQGTAPSCKAGCKSTKRHVKKLPQRDHPLIQSVTSKANTPLQASSYHSSSAHKKPSPKDETERKESSRLNTIPYHIMANATADGRCHRAGCWSSTGLQELRSSAMSK